MRAKCIGPPPPPPTPGKCSPCLLVGGAHVWNQYEDAACLLFLLVWFITYINFWVRERSFPRRSFFFLPNSTRTTKNQTKPTSVHSEEVNLSTGLHLHQIYSLQGNPVSIRRDPSGSPHNFLISPHPLTHPQLIYTNLLHFTPHPTPHIPTSQN
jgi:hypothetical protein